MKEKILHVLKTETVLVVATFLALVSLFFNPPSKEYVGFIDFRVLGILLALMFVMAGYQLNGVFAKLGGKLIAKCNTTLKLSFVLVFLCFFSSMLLTNDVALITFVPFALLTLKMGRKDSLIIPVVVFQTIAANLGSMLTPMGNPQNLYLYGLSGMNIGEFIMLMLPYTLVSAVILVICIFAVIKRESIDAGFVDDEGNEGVARKSHIIIYSALFILCILTVIRFVEWYIVTLIVMGVVLIIDRRVFKKADYSLLLTFIAFFIFIGNMGEIEVVNNMLSSLIEGRELLVSVVSSQVVSNVPAAILLSGFTDNYEALIIGTNLGGLGTLIASMASLISYKQVTGKYKEYTGKYFISFTVYNIMFLAILAVFAYIY